MKANSPHLIGAALRAIRLGDGATIFAGLGNRESRVSPVDQSVHDDASALRSDGTPMWTFNGDFGFTGPDIGIDGTHYVTARGLNAYALTPAGKVRSGILITTWVAAALTMAAHAQLSFLPGDATVAPAAGDQTAPAIARGSNTSLVVWTDNRANPYPSGVYAWSEYETSRDIYGVRLDTAGNVLDAIPLALVARRSNQNYPKVSWNGANWLVVYQSVDVGGTGYYQDSLEAVRVSPAGQVLDAKPIKLYGLTAAFGWAVASDGNNWVVVNQGTPTANDIVAVRISAAGVVLDPPTRVLVPDTNTARFGGLLAYAGGVFMFYYSDASGLKLGRFDSNLTVLTPAPAPSDALFSDLAGNGTSFYAVWPRQDPDGLVHVVGSRVNAAGAILDGTGVNISGTKEPSGYATTAVAWDGVNWRVTWGQLTTAWIARVNSAGVVLDPGSVAVAGVQTGRTAGNGAGGLQIIWTVLDCCSTNFDYNVASAFISATSVAGPARTLSVGAPRQVLPDVATSGNGFMVVYRSSTDSNSRILAQPLDAAGNPLTAQPVQLELGPSYNGPTGPNVAWNGSLYLVSWGSINGIVAQRLSATGAKLDAAPFMVMSGCFGPADVAALGNDFLVTGRKVGINIQYIFPVAARVSGGGAVLDASPLVLGNSYVATAPAVVALGNRWLVAWHRNATHDNSYATSMGAFIDAGGVATPEFQIHGPFSTAGGNGIFEVGLGSSGDKALFVQSQELTSGVENDMLCRVIDAAGAVGPPINLTPWPGNQYRPRVAWDGASFIVAYQEQKNRLALNTLDQLDARSDLYAMRVSPTGVKLDPQGFVFSARPTAETDPTVCAINGTMLLAGAVMVNDNTFANYQIAYDVLPANGPVAVINASATEGDVPLAVDFNSGGSIAMVTYAWNFGDGSTTNFPNPSHTFTVAGEYLVTLTVTDEFGRQTTQAQMINATKPNQVPVAIATADKYSGNAPLDVIFSAAQSYDPDGVIGSMEWLFSDGGYTYGSPAYHTFTAVGTYTATLRCFDARGGIGTTNIIINVGGVNQPPIAHASATPSSGNAPLTVQFSAAGSSDPDGTIVEYYWEFGDAFGTHSYEANPTYIYGYAGTYPATLTVLDNNNVSRSDTVVITVGQNLGTSLRSTAINLTAKLSGSKVTATGQVTVKDGHGTPASGAIVTAQWTRANGSTVTQSATTGRTGIAQFQTTDGRGTYTLTVTDIYKYLYTFDAAGSVLSKSITSLPVLKSGRTAQNVVLSWPTNDVGFTLQSAPLSSANATWSNVAQSPQVSGTNFAVTVPMTGGAVIYRLVQP
jgi:PKD repeat protein